MLVRRTSQPWIRIFSENILRIKTKNVFLCPVYMHLIVKNYEAKWYVQIKVLYLLLGKIQS